MEEVRPGEAVRAEFRRAFVPPVERPYPPERCHGVVKPPRRCPVAVGEREGDARGGAEGDEEGREPPVNVVALAVIGHERREDGEGEDDGGGEEDVEARGPAKDKVQGRRWGGCRRPSSSSIVRYGTEVGRHRFVLGNIRYEVLNLYNKYYIFLIKQDII